MAAAHDHKYKDLAVSPSGAFDSSPVIKVGKATGAPAHECLHLQYNKRRQQFFRCRKCYPCRSLKTALWVRRIHREVQFHPRTWFGTFTYKGPVPDDPYKDFQVWLRRIRKGFKRTHFRYFAITERGTIGGREHIHALLHADRVLTRRQLQETYRWHKGFSKFLLVNESFESIYYVAKYINKGDHQIRASKQYGTSNINFTLPEGVGDPTQ